MICIRPTVAIAVLLLVCILAKPAQSWEPTGNRRTRSLRGFSHSAEKPLQSAGRTLTQSSVLAGGAYNIQSEGRLGSCWSYLSIPKCSKGDTVDLYRSDDGSGRQQWELVSAGGDNLYYLVLSKGRSGCTNWLSGQPCPENRIAAWYTDDTSGRQKWLLSPVGDNTYTISLPQGRTSCDTYLTSSTCDINSAEGAGLTSFVNSDTGSGFERWLITPVSGSSPTSTSSSSPPPSLSSGESSPSSGESSPSSSPMSQTSPVTAPSVVASGTSSCSKKGVVYDFFNQYCPSVLVTNSAYWINFDAGFDSSCSGDVAARHQPMVWGTDRIDSAYSTISALATKPKYLLTFNEPNYAFGGGSPSNVVDPVSAAKLWPQLMSKFNPLGIQLIAPSPIDCAGNPNCHNVGTAAAWLSQFRDTLNSNTPGAWDAIHALNYHTYATDLGSIQSATSSLNKQFGKPIWITEIAAGGGASMETNIALMKAFVPWANSQGWVERYFWNQATPTPNNDPNIKNSYLLKSDGSLSALGKVYASYQC